MFYSVPHHGTFMAEYSVNARYLLFPSIEVKELCKGKWGNTIPRFKIQRDSKCLTNVFRFTSTAQPQWELLERGQREGIQSSEFRRNTPDKHRPHDQDPGGANTVSKYERIITQSISTVQNRMTLVNFDMLWFSDLGIGELIEVDVDHLNICKPVKKDSFLYKRSLKFIQEALQSFVEHWHMSGTTTQPPLDLKWEHSNRQPPPNQLETSCDTTVHLQ